MIFILRQAMSVLKVHKFLADEFTADDRPDEDLLPVPR